MSETHNLVGNPSANCKMSTICNNNNNEQPQIKRQKIEKIKVVKNGRITISNIAQSDLIKMVDVNECNKTQMRSSLSSSFTSTPNNSRNNSPTASPASSRTAPITHFLSVQNISTNSPAMGGVDCCVDNCSNDSREQSAGEIVSVSAHRIPDMMPANSIELVVATSSIITSKSKQNQQFASGSAVVESSINDMREFEESLARQCLCGVAERTLRKPFQSHYSQDASGTKRIANLYEWPTNKLLQFLSNLKLLFDIYLKQNSKGFICTRIMDVCDALIRNDHNLIDEIIVLASYSNAFVQFLAGRVLASFLVIAKQDMNDDWFKKLVDYLFNFEILDQMAVQKINFSLEIIKRIVEWKDVDLHPLEDEIESEAEPHGNAGISTTVTATYEVAAQSSLGTHAFMHFQTQQPTLDKNYFAVHFCTQKSYNEDGDDDDFESDEFCSNHSSKNINNLNNSNHVQPVSATAHYESMDRSSITSNFYITNSDGLQGLHNETDLRNLQQTHYQKLSNVCPCSISSCHIITLTDSESFDTTHLKCITIKILENKWPALVRNMSTLIANHLEVEQAENSVLTFLQLWENIISVKANLSIVETLPFYAQLDKFEMLLNQHLPCAIYKQMLCLFNEALCYGSTLALQDMLPEETCLLAHQIVRHVKDFSILESLPRRHPENIVSMIGFKRKPLVYPKIGTLQCFTQQSPSHLIGSDAIEMDKTILQKIVLLALKSIAVTVKEIRSDSSDCSIDSSDYDAFQDMVMIERSIRDVLHKLEIFIKNTLEFHPECHFSKIVIHLFDDQDDHLVEAMVCTLDVTSGISFRNNAFPELVSMLNPIYTFLEFLRMISHSSDLLLDLLVSNETCFLLYLLRFLKYIRMNWALVVQSCHDFGMGDNALDEAMSVLIRLRLQISRLVARQLYPYDISPVLRLLESCESLYEGNELS